MENNSFIELNKQELTKLVEENKSRKTAPLIIENEVWLPISNDSIYEVSDKGRFRKNYITKAGSRVVKILVPVELHSGVLMVNYTSSKYIKEKESLSKLVWLAFKPEEPFENIDYLNNNPQDCSVTNLYSNPVKRKSKNKIKKIYSEDVPNILRMKNLGFTQQEIAELYGVGQSAISKHLSKL